MAIYERNLALLENYITNIKTKIAQKNAKLLNAVLIFLTLIESYQGIRLVIHTLNADTNTFNDVVSLLIFVGVLGLIVGIYIINKYKLPYYFE